MMRNFSVQMLKMMMETLQVIQKQTFPIAMPTDSGSVEELRPQFGFVSDGRRYRSEKKEHRTNHYLSGMFSTVTSDHY